MTTLNISSGSVNTKDSFLCVGLDTDPNKIPKHLLKEEDPVFAFNKAIISDGHANFMSKSVVFLRNKFEMKWLFLIQANSCSA